MLHNDKDPLPNTGDDALLKELRELNRMLRINVRAQTGIKERFLAGLVTGLGTVIGATVVIGLIVRILAPLGKAEVVGPYIQKIQEQLERPRPDRVVPKAGAENDPAPADVN